MERIWPHCWLANRHHWTLATGHWMTGCSCWNCPCPSHVVFRSTRATRNMTAGNAMLPSQCKAAQLDSCSFTIVGKPLASAMADNGSCSFQRGFDALEVELLRFNRNQNRATNRGKAPKLTLLLLGSTLQGGVGCCRSGCKGNFRHSITVASVCRCCVCRCVVWHCNINTIIIRCVCSCCCVCSRCHR